MLGPFRIRNLQRPATPSSRHPHPTISRRTSLEAIVSITGQEYDQRVFDHPEARLKYLDEDDGEIVTVGTHVELSQRLEEPITHRNVARSSLNPARSNPFAAIAPEMHVFEIDRQGDSVKIWEEIARQTKRLRESETQQKPAAQVVTSPSAAPAFRQPSLRTNRPIVRWVDHSAQSNGDDLNVKFDESDDWCRRLQELWNEYDDPSKGDAKYDGEESEDPRALSFQASHPPQLSQGKMGTASTPSQYTTSMRLSDMLNDEPRVIETPNMDHKLSADSFGRGHLTAEGKRQAVEAGRRLRSRPRSLYCRSRSSPNFFSSVKDTSRWASYGQARPTVGIADSPASAAMPTKTATCVDPAAADAPEGSLFSTFQSELAKLTEPKESVDESGETRNLIPSAEVSEPPFEDVASPFVAASHLVLQTFLSILSNAQTLNAQIRDQARHDCTQSPETSRAKRDLRDVQQEFDSCLRSVSSSITEELFTSPCATAAHQYPDGDTTEAVNDAIKGLQQLTGGFAAMGHSLLQPSRSSASNVQAKPFINSPAGETSEQSKVPTNHDILIDPIPQWADVQSVTNFVRKIEADSYGGETGIRSVKIFRSSSKVQPFAICAIGGLERASAIRHRMSGRIWGTSRICATFSTTPAVAAAPHIISNPSQSTTSTTTPVSSRAAKTHDELPPFHVEHSDNATIEGSRNVLARASVRCDDWPCPITSRSDEIPKRHQPVRRHEPMISYRHIPSPRPIESANLQQPASAMRGSSMNQKPNSTPSRRSWQSSSWDKPRRDEVPVEQNDQSRRSRSRSPSTNLSTSSYSFNQTLRSPSLAFSPSSSDEWNFSPVQQGRESVDPVTCSTGTSAWSFKAGDLGRKGLRVPPVSRYQPAVVDQPSLNVTFKPGFNTDHRQGTRPVSYTQPGTDRCQYLDSVRDRLAPPTPGSSETVKGSLRYSKSLSAIRKASAAPKSVSFKDDMDTVKQAKMPWNAQRNRSEYALQMPKKQAPSPASYGSPFDPIGSPLVAARFPTQEQFEESGNAAPNFPPLPSMEPLVPLRPNAPPIASTEKSSTPEVGGFAKACDPTMSKVYASAWPQKSSGSESSGDFFRRMTGLGEREHTSCAPVSPVQLSPAAPGARLAKPFDPLAETATIHRHQLIEGVRRSATVSGLHDAYRSTNRRPYTTCFDNSGRVERESLANRPLATQQTSYYPRPRAHSGSRRTISHSVASQSWLPPPPPPQPARNESSVPLHHDPSTVSAVQDCVEQLKNLGFARDENGGLGRLVIYAQAAAGKLNDAIDLIDEERKAYEERTVGL